MRSCSLLFLVVAGVASCGGRVDERRPAFTGGATRYFLIEALALHPESGGWRTTGFDLDGRITSSEDSKTSFNGCKRRAGSPTRVLEDGASGIDNNFGHHVLPVLESLDLDLGAALSAANAHLLLRLDNVGPDDNDSVPGTLYVTATADADAVVDASLDHGAPRHVFARGAMAAGVWEGTLPASDSVTLPFPLPHVIAKLELRALRLRLSLHDGRGMLGAALPIDSFVVIELPARPGIATCAEDYIYQVTNTISQSADMRLPADDARECNLVSFGATAAAREVAPFSVIVSTPPIPPIRCTEP